MSTRTTRPLLGLLALPLLAPGLLAPLAAQDAPRAERPRPAEGAVTIVRGAPAAGAPRRILGLSFAEGGNARDTTGLLIIDVTRGSAAEKAGLGPGDRLVRIDGVDLRVDAADAGDGAATTARVRRLRRALDATKDSQPVRLEVLQDGRRRTVEAVPQREQGWRWGAGAAAPPAPGAMWFRGPDGASFEMELRGLRDAQRGLDEQRRVIEMELPRIRAEQRRIVEREMPRALERARREVARVTVRDDDGEGRHLLVERRDIAVSTVNKDLAARLGRGTEGGFLVLRVSDDYAPLKAGDVIMKVDGAAVADRGARFDLDRDRPHRVEVIRDGRTQVLELKAN